MSIVTELKYTANLDKGVCMTPVMPSFMGGDQEAHRIIVDCYRDRKAVDLASAGVTAYFVRADGMTIPLNGETEGNKASVLLPAACYAVMGRFSLVIKLSLGDSINTVFWGEGAISRSRTDVVIDPDSVIPSLEELLARIDAMEKATAAANEAAASVEGFKVEINGQVSQLSKNIENNTFIDASGIKMLTLLPSDFELYATNKYIATDGVETDIDSWDIYEYKLPYRCKIAFRALTKNPDVNGVVYGAVFLGTTNYKVLDQAIDQTAYIADSIKINVLKTGEGAEFAVTDITVAFFARQEIKTVSRGAKGINFDKIVTFGDSIFYGYAIENQRGVVQQVGEMLDLPVEMYAVPGATLTYHEGEELTSVVQQVNNYQLTGKPLFLIDGGTNDQYAFQLENLGTYGANHTGTIYGAITFVVEALLSRGVDPRQIVITTPIPKGIRGDAEYRAKIDAQLTAIGYAMWQVGVAYGCNVVNGYDTVFNFSGDYVDGYYLKVHLMPDDTHPSEMGAGYYAHDIVCALGLKKTN